MLQMIKDHTNSHGENKVTNRFNLPMKFIACVATPVHTHFYALLSILFFSRPLFGKEDLKDILSVCLLFF